MIGNDPAAPFRLGDPVRFLNGPLCFVVSTVDQDGDVCIAWWAEGPTLCYAFAPERLLIHAQAGPMTTDPDYYGEWADQSTGPDPYREWRLRVQRWLKKRLSIGPFQRG